MGAGQRGKFRITQLTRRDTGAVPLEGEFYKLQLAHRADLASSEYRERAADRGLLWVAGGVLTAPFAARDFAWRQFRDEKSLVDPSHSDEIHAYVPQQRRVERLASARVDGLFVPAFSVGGMPDQQLAIPGAGGGAVSAGGSGSGALGGQLGAGASGGGPGGSGGGVSGLPVAQSSAVDRGLESGFGALALRPNLFEWRVVGVRDVLAPINIAAPVYPEAKERSFGPSGLALADRWELRRALVLEARDRRASGAAQGGARTVWYLDLQTLAPLYTVQHDASGAPLSVGIHAGRWSEDRSDYPRWSDDAARPVRVLDSVAELHLPLGGGDGWRRESWDVVAIAPTGEALEQLLSVAPLQRGD
jgi:hypothetical protein